MTDTDEAPPPEDGNAGNDPLALAAIYRRKGSANMLFSVYPVSLNRAVPTGSLADIQVAPTASITGTTFVVDSTGDGGDSNIGNGICDDGSGACTLRAAIQEANDDSDRDTIQFNISGTGPHTIQPQSELPAITKEVVIDGTTQSGYSLDTPMIVINGASAGSSSEGLRVKGGNSTVRGLVVNGFDSYGILLYTNDGNLVEACFVGTSASGTSAVGNFQGIRITSSDNVVGGTTAGTRNLIVGNTDDGVHITGQISGNTVQGNYIGTDVNGTSALSNGDDGIHIRIATYTTVGGTTAGARNMISGNSDFGIMAQDGAANTLIQGNYIGTDVSGTQDLGNGNNGIGIGQDYDTIIGGTAAGAGNLISGNGGKGIFTYADTTGSTDLLIQGNLIGTDVNGTTAIANDNRGVWLEDTTNVTVGGLDTGAGNLISGNEDEGILVYVDATNTVIQGNKIGTNLSGTAGIPNGVVGIKIEDSSNTTVEGNTIGYNVYDGIWLNPDSGMPVNNEISANRIFANGGLGIALDNDGVTANDSGDTDSGPNQLQNYPVIAAASSDGVASTMVTGTLNSAANTTFRIEFFASEACDASGYGEGEDYLGYADVSTDGNGNVSFSAELAAGAAEDSVLTATATDPNGNTSEFSACTAIEVTSSATGLSYDWFYDYDPLYRLTYACSSDWDPGSETCGGEHEFSYTYDSVGNRLTKVVNSQVITYTYDIANRLTDAGGVAYTWDDNGNLTYDGVYTYTYSHANRLVAVIDASSSTSYGYNGLGDRVQQTVDGNTTYYSLDLAAGLTQVLDDGDNTYLYGLVRIGEEQPGGWVFHHGDALGSVRQLTDGNGDVTLVRSYQPYGEVLASSGDGTTNYSFTGEWTDTSGLIFLQGKILFALGWTLFDKGCVGGQCQSADFVQ